MSWPVKSFSSGNHLLMRRNRHRVDPTRSCSRRDHSHRSPRNTSRRCNRGCRWRNCRIPKRDLHILHRSPPRRSWQRPNQHRPDPIRYCSSKDPPHTRFRSTWRPSNTANRWAARKGPRFPPRIHHHRRNHRWACSHNCHQHMNPACRGHCHRNSRLHRDRPGHHHSRPRHQAWNRGRRH